MNKNLSTPAGAAILAICLAAGVPSCATTDPADLNRDGVTSVPEFESYLVDAIIDYSDSNHDQRLTYSEWEKVNSNARMSQFVQRDLNGDGFLDRTEAVKSTKQSELWRRIIIKIDSDGNGTIDDHEKDAFRKRLRGEDVGDKVDKLILIAAEE